VSRRVLSAALAAGALLLTAGAGTGAVQTPDLSSKHGVAQYLQSLGLSPDGFVVQRGAKNYAGPRCPGKAWNCTRAARVVQIGSVAAATNSFTCTPASTGTNAATSTCVIVQSAGKGQNLATCTETTSDSAGATVVQTCTITQTSDTGKNVARVIQQVIHGPPGPAGQAQGSKQFATVTQSNNSGPNIAEVSQELRQALSTAATSVAQSQHSEQHFQIQQSGLPFSPTNCPSMTGSNSATAAQTLGQTATASSATSGTQIQTALLDGHIDQCSNSNSTYTATQTESQTASAGAGVTQKQFGPQQCCSFQGDNPSDRCEINQTSTQLGNQSPTQSESITSNGESSGSCAANISATQNGQTTTSNLSGTSFSQTLLCNQGSCQTFTPHPRTARRP
jgi:trimeric autotransporter adhesin